MAQHDYNIANQSGADFRADLNNALLAIATVNSGSTEPSTTFAHQLWVDTSSSVLKIRNAADNAWITTGVSITASNTFTGNLTGNVTGNLTGNVTGNVTGDLTGNADSADILTTARTISLSGDVVGSVSFDGSTNVDIDTVVQINSITLGTDTTGDYVESMSGGTGVTVTGGTGEGSTPSIAIGQAVATTDDVTFNIITATEEFIGDLEGGIRFNAKADGALSKGDVVYISGVSGDVPTVAQAKANDASKMPAFGLALSDANDNAALQVVTFGTIEELDTSNVSEGQILYVSTTAGAYTTTAPTGESSQIQNIGKVIRSHAAAGSIKVGGAGRSNATPNLDNGKIFIGNGSNQSTTATLDTSIVVENTNLYYTTARANTDFDSRLATKDTGDLTEGSNLYYTTARVNTDFDTRLATKDTGDLTEGSNLYYTDARVNSAFDTRLATKDTDDVSEGTTNLYYTTSRTNTDFDTRLATKSTSDLAEGTNLYYTSARFDSAFTSKDTDDLSEGTTNLYYTTTRFDSAFGNKTTADLTENTNLYYTDTRANSAIDARVTKAFVDALGIQANTVAANSVALGTDTTGNYIQTITGTANKITVSGSGSESADVTLSLPDDVQIADSLTVAGNLTVNGTLTSLDTTNLDIEDNLFQLNAGLTGSPVNDSGMLINRGTADNSIFMWDESVDKFTMGLTTADGSATGNITLNSLGTLVVNVEGDLTGAVTGTVSSLSNHDTADLTEGSNLYYTQARFDSAFTAKSTSDLSEGTNLYYTDARFDTRLASKDTDDVSEGTSNLYYTSTRFDSAFGGKSTSDLSEGTNLYYTSARANTDFDTRLATKDTGDLSEGSNLYYTDARVQAVSINNVAEDTTPQLGGNLDLNSSDITGTGDINITGTIQSSGNITGTLATAAQPNITSVGSLTGLDVNGTITSYGLNFDISDGVEINALESIVFDIDSDNNQTGRVFQVKANNSTALMTITETGNVGIGVSSPDEKLDIEGNLRVESTSSNGTYLALRNGATNGRAYRIGSNFVTGAGELAIYDDTAGAERMRIDASGNVGIGISSPDTKLHVSGNAYVAAGNYFTDSTSGYFFGGNGSFTNGVYGVGTNNMAFNVNGSERMRIDASGNVGIGISSPASAFGFSKTLEIQGGANAEVNISQTDNSKDWSLGITNGVNYQQTTSGQAYAWESGGTERMRIDSSGNVGIGNTNPSGMSSNANKLVVGTGSGDQGMSVYAGTSTGRYAFARAVGDNTDAYDGGMAYDGSRNLTFHTNANAERMRISGTGTLLVSTTTASGLSNGTTNYGHSFGGGQQVNATNNDINLILNMSNGSSNPHVQFRSDGGNTGNISTNGSAVSYNAGSDYRLKENVIPLKDGLDRLNKLNPVQFDWKKSQETDEGFIAHEVQEIVPYVVKGEKDGEEIQSMDYGKLTPLLVKAIQEQQELINNLTSRIEGLEN